MSMYSEGIPQEKAASGSGRKSVIKFLRYTIGLAIAIALMLVFGMFLTGQMTAIEVGGNSMTPTLLNGDRVLARAADPSESIERGALVIVKSPDDDGPDMIKRVVGIPGDKVEFRQREFFVNDHPSPPPGADRSIHLGKENTIIELGSGEYFVLGDNRGTSHDSEEFGPLPRESIHSRLFYRYGPWSRRGRL